MTYLLIHLLLGCGAKCGSGTTLVDGYCTVDGDTGSSGNDTDTATDTDTSTDTDSATDTGSSTDADADGHSVDDGDCDDTNPAVFPGAPETEDSLDDDCDGYVDEWDVCASGGVYTTIQPALDDADDGQIILVCPGTYSENLDFGGVDAVVVSTGGPTETTIDGGGAGPVVMFRSSESSAAVLEGFTVTNGAGETTGATVDLLTGGGISIDNASPTILGNVISWNTAQLGGGVRVYGTRAAPTLLHNVIMNNRTDSGAGGGMYFDSSTSGTVENNVIIQNTADWSAGGMMVASSVGLVLRNNVFADNVTTNKYGYLVGADLSLYGDGTATIQNNIFAYGVNGPGIGSIGASTVAECSYNDAFDNDGGDIAAPACASATNLTGDPIFVSSSGGDYHLQSSSPCVDAGNPDAAFVDEDGSRNDIGAYGGQSGSW